MRRRIGILGGTFDPVHAGHLDIARHCASRLGLSEVRLLCSSLPPHKPQPETAGHHRHAMVALATASEDALVADPRELVRGGATYTVDTLTELRSAMPDAELHFLIGADSLRDLRTWRRPDEILALAVIVAVGRSGVALDAAADGFQAEIARGRVVVLRHEPPPWSSTALRAALRTGEAPEGALDTTVAAYIRKNELYGTGGAAASGPGRTP